MPTAAADALRASLTANLDAARAAVQAEDYDRALDLAAARDAELRALEHVLMDHGVALRRMSGPRAVEPTGLDVGRHMTHAPAMP